MNNKGYCFKCRKTVSVYKTGGYRGLKMRCVICDNVVRKVHTDRETMKKFIDFFKVG